MLHLTGMHQLRIFPWSTPYHQLKRHQNHMPNNSISSLTLIFQKKVEVQENHQDCEFCEHMGPTFGTV